MTEKHRNAIPFEALISEAEGQALSEDSPHTLACLRATLELGAILKLEDPSWNDIKSARLAMDYGRLAETFMSLCGIRCLLLDDGLGGVAEFAEPWDWHNRFCETKRIVRIELEAEVFLHRVDTAMIDADACTSARKLWPIYLRPMDSHQKQTLICSIRNFHGLYMISTRI